MKTYQIKEQEVIDTNIDKCNLCIFMNTSIRGSPVCVKYPFVESCNKDNRQDGKEVYFIFEEFVS